MTPTDPEADHNAAYQRDLARARDTNTDLIERDDLPAPDHYHAARDLAELLTSQGENVAQLAGEIGLPGDDPALWERLDVSRAAAHARARYPDAFAPVAQAHPWLAESADESSPGALGALGDSFLGG